MPWSASDAKRFKKGLTPKQARQWAHVANGALSDCLKKGGKQSDCEGKAVRMANGVAGRKAMKESDMADEVLDKEQNEEEQMLEKGYVPYGITSFDDLDKARAVDELTEATFDVVSDFQGLVWNVTNNPDIPDKIGAIASLTDALKSRFPSETGVMDENKECDDCGDEVKEGDVWPEDLEGVHNKSMELKAVWSTAFVNDLPDSSFLLVTPGCGSKDEGGKTTPRTCRHLPYKDSGGKIDLPHVRNAIARIPQMKGVSAEKKASLQARARKILASASKERGEEMLDDRTLVAIVKESILNLFSPKQEHPDSEFMVWKEAGGQMRWLAVYSNNFRDDDNIPEIISESSHRNFVDLVETKQADMPELWLWHVPEWRFGVADWIAWDDAGFAVASGSIDRGKEAVAEWISKQSNVAVSHGMPYRFIERDPDDQTIITRHITKEISPLPDWAAANKRTGFVVLDASTELSKEDDMAIPAKKKQELIDKWNADPTLLESLETSNAETAAEAHKEGVESKDKDTEETAAEVSATETEATETQGDTQTEETDAPPYPTRAEVAENVAEVLTPIRSQMEELTTQVAALAEMVKEKLGGTEDKSIDPLTPASIAAMISQRMSVVADGSAAKMTGKDKLAEAKPKENEDVPGRIGIPFVDKWFAEENKQQ